MISLLAVVMVCALNVAPADCTRATALDVIVQPVGLPTECMQVGPTLAASTFGALDGRYVKTACERRKS
ncbi:hypothetical protein ABEV34_06850 [Methylorubrum rhodesianum]|uniref:hypothetical protein n=1 Tax=Methylorubrum TaxID=2282523 RepID=UPI0016129EFB|nr:MULTISPECIES: hypothetical protein [Methylorubrum]MBB5765688.1 hypothetical protein [Methylorubrum rhodesianum]MBI1691543.1 hypothetical protein [Methylorubrum sp. DB1722]